MLSGEIERQLLMVLLENIPEQGARPKRENESLLNGPQVDASKAGVVASQIRLTTCWIASGSDEYLPDVRRGPLIRLTRNTA